MSFAFSNLVILAGLLAVAIPPIIHLWNRRRYVVVDWGAMQFLQMSQTTQRRILWEDLLLMLLRMGLIALLVFSLAGPYVTGPLVAGLGQEAGRDFVVVLDASASMSRSNEAGEKLSDAARGWCQNFVKRLKAGDRVAIVQAQQQTLPVVPVLTSDFHFAVEQLSKLKPVGGACRWPAAVAEALRILDAGQRLRRHVILVGDNQRFGFSDPEALGAWESLAPQFDNANPPTKAYAVVMEPAQGSTNYSLAAMTSGRAAPWVGQTIPFRTALKLDGFEKFQFPTRLRLEANGRPIRDLNLPEATTTQGQLPIKFDHKFGEPGVHLMSVIVEAEPASDAVPVDNRVDFAVEVLASLPVLLIDGGEPGAAASSSFFLEKALNFSPAGSKSGVQAKVISIAAFEQDPSIIGTAQPRAIILADPPPLSEAAAKRLTEFIEGGGGALVCLGGRVGTRPVPQAWMPAKLDGISDEATSIAIPSLQHPALDIFREQAATTLSMVKFPRVWKAVPPEESALVAARFTNDLPWLIERRAGKGRVVLCTIPFDRSWGSDFPTRWEFPVLVHELVYYLAQARSAEFNVEPGRTLTIAAAKESSTVVETPDGAKTEIPSKGAAEFTAQQVGVYRVKASDRPAVYYVAQPDVRESDLTPRSDEDWKTVTSLLPMGRIDASAVLVTDGDEQPAADLWWLFLLAVAGLLCIELWMTRRMAISRVAT